LFPPDIKGFLSDVKPALLSALDAEYEKNPFEVCCLGHCIENVFFVWSVNGMNYVELTGCCCSSKKNS
jgi:hypothetical protein